MHWGWQQWVYIAFTAIGVVVAGTHHGQPKVDKDGKPFKYNFVITSVMTGLILAVLASGGFFG